MKKEIIATKNAPSAIGTYSQAIKAGNTLYVSGQLGLNPATMELPNDFATQATQVFKNIEAILQASEASFSDVVKVNISMTDLANFAQVNQIMAQFFEEPYPARAAVGVKSLPKDALIEAEVIAVLSK